MPSVALFAGGIVGTAVAAATESRIAAEIVAVGEPVTTGTQAFVE